MNNLELMHARLGVRGGEAQQDRMIKDKRESLDKALLYSYQGAQVRKLGSETVERALINPNQVKQNYDDKIISIGYEYGYEPGTVFEWVNTGTKWLIYLQDLTELAYFKGDIRNCSYEISWETADGGRETVWAAVRGPVETKIDSGVKSGVSLDSPNHSLYLMLPKTKAVVEQFTRYSKFYLKPTSEGEQPICWRVEATDTVSMPGILEIHAIEYYANEDADDITEGIVDGLLVQETPEPATAVIEGEIFIKPKRSYTYKYTGSENSVWSYDRNLPIEVNENNKEITIKWLKTYTGQFVLSYGKEEKTIVVESLF